MLALRADRVYRGPGDCGPGVLVVEDGVLADVRTDGDDLPPDVTDLGDVTVLPGLIDCHVHLAFDSSADVVTPLLDDDDDALVRRMADNARTALTVGVTTVRDLGDRRFVSLVLRDALRADPPSGPELLVSGPPLTRTRGHCWFLGGEADTAEQLRAAVRDRAARGCDVVKIMVTGGALTPGFALHESQYGVEHLTAVVAEAHAVGLPVAAHAHGPAGIRDSVAAGVDSVEHCSWFTADGVDVDWEVARQMANAGIVLGATLGQRPGAAPLPAVAHRLETYFANVVELIGLGATVACGTDGGVSPGKPHDVLPRGIVALTDRGVPFDEALATATTTAAAACGVAERKGRLERGYDADLLVVRGDPRRDPAALLEVDSVYRAGVGAALR
ncbi:amidohydrolase family protein [Blastococcus sp. TF02A-30]|uniref:amidohydrolase family protein n=1 Tax=Blastococcus sp. TF02A-30 TaxID=2250580 RepID=UPI000DEB242D|nr:amidohydrolase family protein [Blastococcus sp. TF02A-30]RBY91408.1 amidohydrolase family protein [Blastococcus sp. TF02A-30]